MDSKDFARKIRCQQKRLYKHKIREW